MVPAAAVSALGWIILGMLAAAIAGPPRPADYVLSMVKAGRVSLERIHKRPMRPSGAAISAREDHPLGHPNPERLVRLEMARARILGTDRDGTVHALRGGENIEVGCFVARPEKNGRAGSSQAQPPDREKHGEQ